MTRARSLRESRLFPADGRALVVAMDHARRARQVTGLIRANEIIETVVGAGADAVLLPHGSAVAASDVVESAGVWLSVDTTPAIASGAVERALRLGVDGIKIEIYPYSGDRETLQNLSAMASECGKWGLPLMVEAVPFGWTGADKRTAETIIASCRIASDGGADYVKAFYTGDTDSFRTLIDNCSVPVLVLGGPKTDSDRDVLTMVRDAMDAGAVGVTMGRNIWRHDDVAGMTRALAAIIHDDASVDTAYRHLG
jgi:DhnA family fructose-bisphosphate aldolase class Ia